MATEREGSRLVGPFALAFGVAYLLIAVLEIVAGDALEPMLRYTAPMNALHWLVGVTLLLALLATRPTTTVLVRVVGALLFLLAVVSVLARQQTGDLFVFGEPMPFASIALHGLTGIALLVSTVPRWTAPRQAPDGSTQGASA